MVSGSGKATGSFIAAVDRSLQEREVSHSTFRVTCEPHHAMAAFGSRIGEASLDGANDAVCLLT